MLRLVGWLLVFGLVLGLIGLVVGVVGLFLALLVAPPHIDMASDPAGAYSFSSSAVVSRFASPPSSMHCSLPSQRSV